MKDYFEESNFPYLSSICQGEFGEKEGKKIYEKAVENLEKLIDEADYKGSKAVENHMRTNMLPPIAYYQAILACTKKTKEEAKSCVLLVTQRHALKLMKKYSRIGHMPFGYGLFRKAIRSVVKKNYPSEGWEIEWPKTGKREVRFDMKTCIYHETTKKYGCPELCTVFCANDTTAFKGLLPKIDFMRAGTLAEGKAQCDFHYIKNGCGHVMLKNGDLKFEKK